MISRLKPADTARVEAYIRASRPSRAPAFLALAALVVVLGSGPLSRLLSDLTL